MRQFRAAGLAKSLPLIEKLKSIGESHGATPAQVALAWTILRNGTRVVAIPGASSVSQATSNAAAMAVSLSAEEIDQIDRAAQELV